MHEQHDFDTMEDILDVVSEAGQGEIITVADVVKEIGEDAFAPLMLVPALIAITPLSGIPGLSTFCGLMIALIAVQMVLMRSSLWLPAFIMRRSITRKRLDKAQSWLKKPARFVDRLTKARLCFLVKPPFSLLPAIICLMLGLMMPVMEFIPFSATIAATAVSLFALAFITEDGLLGLFGLGVIFCGLYLGFTALA